MPLRSLFEDHPASVGETYWQHMASAWGFSWRMAVASLACLIHALLPFVFEKYGSQMITKLHDRMVLNRHRNSQAGHDSQAAPQAQAQTQAQTAVQTPALQSERSAA